MTPSRAWNPRLSFGAMNRSGPPPVAASVLYLLKRSANGTSTVVMFRSGFSAPAFAVPLTVPATVARTSLRASSSVPAPDEYECQSVRSPARAAGAAEAGAADAGAADAAVVGAVEAPLDGAVLGAAGAAGDGDDRHPQRQGRESKLLVHLGRVSSLIRITAIRSTVVGSVVADPSAGGPGVWSPRAAAVHRYVHGEPHRCGDRSPLVDGQAGSPATSSPWRETGPVDPRTMSRVSSCRCSGLARPRRSTTVRSRRTASSPLRRIG